MKNFLLWSLAIVLGICTCGLAFIPIVMVVLLIKSHPNDEKSTKIIASAPNSPSLFSLIQGEMELPKASEEVK